MVALLAAGCASVIGQSHLYETMVILSESRAQPLATLAQVAGAQRHWVDGKQLLLHLLSQFGVISFWCWEFSLIHFVVRPSWFLWSILAIGWVLDALTPCVDHTSICERGQHLVLKERYMNFHFLWFWQSVQWMQIWIYCLLLDTAAAWLGHIVVIDEVIAN